MSDVRSKRNFRRRVEPAMDGEDGEGGEIKGAHEKEQIREMVTEVDEAEEGEEEEEEATGMDVDKEHTPIAKKQTVAGRSKGVVGNTPVMPKSKDSGSDRMVKKSAGKATPKPKSLLSFHDDEEEGEVLKVSCSSPDFCAHRPFMHLYLCIYASMYLSGYLCIHTYMYM